MNKLVLSALAATVAVGTTNASEGDWAGLDAELVSLVLRELAAVELLGRLDVVGLEGLQRHPVESGPRRDLQAGQPSARRCGAVGSGGAARRRGGSRTGQPNGTGRGGSEAGKASDSRILDWHTLPICSTGENVS